MDDFMLLSLSYFLSLPFVIHTLYSVHAWLSDDHCFLNNSQMSSSSYSCVSQVMLTASY